jgi:hypothetical protein
MLVMAARYAREDESMTRYRRFILGAVVWVLVVTAGAALVWTVISKAGAGVAGELPATTVTPTVTSTGSQPAPNPPSGSAAQSNSAPAPPTGPVRRSWQGAAGVVVGECQGGAISLASARPNSGWSMEVDHEGGPEGLRVEFESGETRVRVEASCVDGRPAFTVESD